MLSSPSSLSLNPFEVREVLQVCCFTEQHGCEVSIPLKSGRCCKLSEPDNACMFCLNPFEVREVLQAKELAMVERTEGLNPFEVREVLQEAWGSNDLAQAVSIPLKSGRCCKTQGYVLGADDGSQSL